MKGRQGKKKGGVELSGYLLSISIPFLFEDFPPCKPWQEAGFLQAHLLTFLAFLAVTVWACDPVLDKQSQLPKAVNLELVIPRSRAENFFWCQSRW